MVEKLKIYLCDLVHNYLGTSTDMFPLNIGYIASYAKKFFGDNIEITLFKYPDEFMREFEKNPAHLVGFSHYAWNTDLDAKMTKWLKSIAPETIVVYGGPSVNYTEKGYNKFFQRHKEADFYIPFQGETGFVNLLNEVFSQGLDLNYLRSTSIDGVVSQLPVTGELVIGKQTPRIKDLNEIPSPFLTGILDKFFEDRLIPIMSASRGCPYRCTYCSQGISSHNQVDFFSDERVKAELEYIAQRAKNSNILIITDANFGLANRDIEIANYIAMLREKYGYPHKVEVNWAKNQPNILEIVRAFQNTVLIISFQSLTDEVLKNIKRQNVSADIFREVIRKVNDEGGSAGTELILGLPGETKITYLENLRKLFDWDLSYILCYNFMLLDGSEISVDREEGKYYCQTKFRLIDNSFGKYREDLFSFEVEEGVVGYEGMSEDDILYFRPVHWLIHFMWNYRFYYELLRYIQMQGVNPMDYIIELIECFDKAPEKLRAIFQEYQEVARKEWWDSADEVRDFYQNSENFEELSHSHHGKMNNHYTFKVLLEAKNEFELYLYETAINFSDKLAGKKDIIREIIYYLSASIINFNKEISELVGERYLPFNYNILEWKKSRYQKDLDSLRVQEPLKVSFSLPESQAQALEKVIKQYGHQDKVFTLRKMVEYMAVRDLLKKTELLS